MSLITGSGAPESLTGAGGNDTIQGLGGNDTLQGLGGDDSLDGGFDDNLLEGGEGNDTLRGSFDDDTLNGGAGDDFLSPLTGANVVDGGPGRDTLSTPGVIVAGSTAFIDLDAGTGNSGAPGSLATFTVTGVENVLGTPGFNDTLIGDEADNQLFGLGGDDSVRGGNGNDQVDGGSGSDTLDGGAGIDATDYTNSAFPITLQPAQVGAGAPGGGGPQLDDPSFIVTAGGDIDLLSSIERFTGSVEADTFRLPAGDWAVVGGTGQDLLILAGQRAAYGAVTIPGGLRITGPGTQVDALNVELVQFDTGDPIPITDLLAGPLPVISINDDSDAEGNDGTRAINFAVTLSAPSASPVTVAFATASDTATAGEDFTSQAGTLTFAPGETQKVISVAILGDRAVETHETFGVVLSNPTGATLAPDAQIGTGTIVNDDVARATLVPQPSASLSEGGQGGLTVRLGGFYTFSTFVDIRASRGYRFSSDEAEITFSVGGVADNGLEYGFEVEVEAGQTEATVQFTAVDDVFLEGPEFLRFAIGGVEGDPGLTFDPSTILMDVVSDDTGTPPAINGVVIVDISGFFSGDAQNDSLGGGSGSNFVLGGGGADIVEANDGDDLMFGDLLVNPGFAPPPGGPEAADPPGANDDSLSGGGGADTISGGPGEDTMLGGEGSDFVLGESGNDTGFGGNGDDVLFGGEGDDYLYGEDGVDFLFGDAGANTLVGGAGNDRIHVNAGDIVADGGEGVFDVLVVLDIGATPLAIDLGQPINQCRTPGDLNLFDFEAVDASIATAPVSVTGAVLNGFGNVLFASTFDDTITGSALADIILGNQGADILAGGDGDDTLIADAGSDTLTGGAGADDLFHPGGPGTMRVADFVAGSDQVVLLASLGLTPDAALAQTAQQGADAVLSLPGGGTVILAGVQVATLGAGDFLVV